jgi:hypothetical protein
MNLKGDRYIYAEITRRPGHGANQGIYQRQAARIPINQIPACHEDGIVTIPSLLAMEWDCTFLTPL